MESMSPDGIDEFEEMLPIQENAVQGTGKVIVRTQVLFWVVGGLKLEADLQLSTLSLLRLRRAVQKLCMPLRKVSGKERPQKGQRTKRKTTILHCTRRANSAEKLQKRV